jgi:hypothetical protein
VALGVFFVAAAACLSLAAVHLGSNGTFRGWWVQVGLGMFGALAAAAGVWVCCCAAGFTLVLDRPRDTVTLRRRHFFRSTVEQYPAKAILEVRVTKEREGKADPVYRVELVLDTGSVVPLSPCDAHDREGCMRAADRLWAALGLPRT